MTSTNWLWCGAPTTTSLQPVFELSAPAASLRAAFSVTPDFAAPIYSSTVATDANNVARPGDVTGLSPGVRYYYAAEIDGVLDAANVGRARTLSDTGTTARLTFASCWDTGLDNPVGAAVVAQDPLMHLFHGDFGYPNITLNDQSLYRANYDGQLTVPNLKALTRNVTFDLMWDDHDFGPDNSDSTNPGRPAAAAVYRQCVPHFTLPDAGAIYHSFTIPNIGVRVVVTDLRYYRSVDTVTDDASKTMLGATQKAWLKNEWLTAKNAGQLIVWVNTQAWPIDNFNALNSDSDHWHAFSTERRELDNYRRVNQIRNMVILTGDAHQIAYKAANDFSDQAGGPAVPVPVYNAAAMSRAPAFRPGPWDAVSSATEGDGHYGLLEITKGASGGWYVRCEFHHVTDAVGDTISFAHARAFDLPTIAASRSRRTTGTEGVVKRSTGGTANLKRLA